MKKLLTILFSLATTAVFSQVNAPSIQWQKCLGGSDGDFAAAIQQTKDGGYVVAGWTGSTDGDVTGFRGYLDCWVVKLSSVGTLQWEKTLGGTGEDRVYAIEQTRDGGYVVAGCSGNNNGDVTSNKGNSDFWVIKLSATGIVQWEKSLGGSGLDWAKSIQQTSDGGYIVGGTSYSRDGDVGGNKGGGDYWVVKLNILGRVEWQKSLGGTGKDQAWAVRQTTDGGYIVSGESYSQDGDVVGNHGNADYWVVKLSGSGAIQWQKALGGTGWDYSPDVQQTKDGGFILAGPSGSHDGDVTGGHGDFDYWVVKLDLRGNIQWQKTFGGSGWDNAYAIRLTDNGYIITGISVSNNGDATFQRGDGDYWVIKLNEAGDLQWQKSMGGTRPDYAYDIQPTSDNGFVVAGGTYSTNGDVIGSHGVFDMWVVKLAPSPTAVSNPTTPPSFSLSPNPATTEIRIQTSETIRAVLLTDMSGKEVFRGGAVNVISTAELANGLYLVRIQTDKGATTQKVLVQH